MKIIRKVALITGASSGIGAATAVEFAKHGVKVVIGGRNVENLEKTAKKCNEAGLKENEILRILGDVTKTEICERLVDKTLDQFGGLDILVNNAGGGKAGNVIDATSEDLDEMMDVHVKAPFNITQRALPAIIKSKGTITFVSSMFHLKPNSVAPTYSMAKSAQGAYCKVLAQELTQKGVTVNAVCPGLTFTNCLGDIESDIPVVDDMTARQAIENFSKTCHQPRCAEPEEVAETIAFLASTGAEMINGAWIPIDKGAHIAYNLNDEK